MLCCPVCAEPFRAPPADNPPITLGCAHTVCASCDAAVLPMAAFTCVSCSKCVPSGMYEAESSRCHECRDAALYSVSSNSKLSELVSTASLAAAPVSVLSKFCPVCHHCTVPGVVNAALAELSEAALASTDTDSVLPFCFECQSLDDAKVEAVSKCTSCKARVLCADHASLHERRGHVLDSILPAGFRPTPTHCAEHAGEPLHFFCVTDAMPVCRSCTVLRHPVGTHRVVPIADAAATLAAHVRSEVTGAQLAADALDATVRGVAAAKASVVQAGNRVTADFKRSVQALHDALDAAAKQHAAAVDALVRSRVKALEVQLDDALVSSSQLGALISLGNAALETGNALKLHDAFGAVRSGRALFRPVNGPTVPVGVAVACDVDALKAAIASLSRVVLYDIDPVATGASLQGPGALKCLSGASAAAQANNRLAFRCVCPVTQEVQTAVTTGDVQVSFAGQCSDELPVTALPDVGHIVVASRPGVFQVSYAVPPGISVLYITVRVCGRVITLPRWQCSACEAVNPLPGTAVTKGLLTCRGCTASVKASATLWQCPYCAQVNPASASACPCAVGVSARGSAVPLDEQGYALAGALVVPVVS